MPYKAPAAPKPVSTPTPTANNPSSPKPTNAPKPVTPVSMPYIPTANNQFPVPAAAAVAAKYAVQQVAKKADDVAAVAKKANSNVGVNDLPKKSTPAPRKSDVSKTSDINKTPDAPNYPPPTVSRTTSDVVANYQRRIDNLRNEFSHPNIRDNGNVAIADIDINGVNIDSIAAHSRIRKRNKGFSGDGQTKFDSIELPSLREDGSWTSPYNRKIDTEYQIFSNVADRLGGNYQAKGKITIYSEKEVCASCSGVAQQFKARYPNISIQIIDGMGKILTY